MKYANLMICLLSAFALLGLSSDACGNQQSDQFGPPGKLPTIPELRHPITTPKPKTGYTMKNIKPSPYTDYKIVHVTPDPNINYTIRNVGPESGGPFIWRDYRYDGKNRKGCPRK